MKGSTGNAVLDESLSDFLGYIIESSELTHGIEDSHNHIRVSIDITTNVIYFSDKLPMKRLVESLRMDPLLKELDWTFNEENNVLVVSQTEIDKIYKLKTRKS